MTKQQQVQPAANDGVVLHNTAATKQRPTEEAYAECQHAYDFYNNELFDGELPPCLITYQRQKTSFGYFSRNRFVRRSDGQMTDEIALNPEFFAVVPLVEVLQTIVHEMVHLWQEHFGTPSRKCYHSLEWAAKMEAIGLMPSDTGLPGGKKTGQRVADYMIVGGLFEAATKRLLASGFAISWLDRFPAQPPARFLVQQPASPLSAGEGDSSEEVVLTLDEHATALLEAAMMPPSAMEPALIEGVKTGNRSNRSKYTCPTCQLNVWGKPGIRIRCEECDELLLDAGDE